MIPHDEIEPTRTERRNGWTAEALRQYIISREKAALIRVFGDPKDRKRPLIVLRKFSPLQWRKGKR